jgi:hypothetical protein
MNRRALLGSISILGASGIAGYSFIRRRFSNYPDLPDNATSLSYTVHRRVDNGVLLKGDFSAGLALVTDAAGLGQFRTDWQTAEDRAFFEATDFSTSFLLGPQIITSGDSTGIDIVDVVQTPDGEFTHTATWRIPRCRTMRSCEGSLSASNEPGRHRLRRTIRIEAGIPTPT